MIDERHQNLRFQQFFITGQAEKLTNNVIRDSLLQCMYENEKYREENEMKNTANVEIFVVTIFHGLNFYGVKFRG